MEELVWVLESYKSKLYHLGNDADFMLDKSRADRLKYYESVLSLQDWNTYVDLVALKSFDDGLEVVYNDW
jgi:hypothetical protein